MGWYLLPPLIHMISTIKCYYNTGFNLQNRPSNEAVLQLAHMVEFPSIQIYQNLGLFNVNIKTQFNNIVGCDYAQIDNNYYIVSDVQMVNEMNAQLTLILDPILSCGGVTNFQINGGWVKRCHVSNDDLFSNNIAENFIPSSRMVRETPTMIGGFTENEEFLNVVGSTVDLSSTNRYADSYYDAATQTTTLVNVPMLPRAPVETWLGILGSAGNNFQIPLTTLFIRDNETTKGGIDSVRSLGIENAITSSYSLPKSGIQYTAKTDNEAILEGVYGKQIDTTSPYNFRYGNYTPKNNKVYSQFNSFTLLSGVSGATVDYDAKDLYANNNAPVFTTTVDPSPTGKPYIQPKTYMGKATLKFQDSIPGGPWLNAPIGYYSASAATLTNAGVFREASRATTEYGLNTSKGILGIVSSFFDNGITGSVSAGLDVGQQHNNYMRDMSDLNLKTQTDQNVIPPDIKFPYDTNLQGYIGNVFYISQTHLADSDLERFDNFLTQYGYAVDKKLELGDFTSRTQFNFIQTIGASISVENKPLRIIDMINQDLNNGIRLWHVLPNNAALTNNPIR